MTVFRFEVTDENPAHVRATLWCGPDVDHLGLAGTLTFRVGEWPAFAAAITAHNERRDRSVSRPATGPVYDCNGRKVYLTSAGTFVIAEHGQWLPGAYADLPAAMAAFDLDDGVLVDLRDATDGPVTFAAVRSRANQNPEGEPR